MFVNPSRIVSKSRHLTKEWRKPKGYSFAAKTQVVPIVAAEIKHCVRFFPVGIIGQSNEHELVAILGRVPDENLFVAPDGRWIGNYIPAMIRGYPFRLVQTKEEQLLLGFDESSGLIQDSGLEEGATRFYDDEGNPTEDTQKMVEFLTFTHQNLQQSRKAVNMLAELDLLEPWSITPESKDPSGAAASKVSEKKLNSIDGERLARLHGAGALGIAYAQLLSMQNVENFTQLAQIHDQQAKLKVARSPALPADFLSREDGDLLIDWDQVLKP